MPSRFVPSPTSKTVARADDPAAIEDVRCVVRLRGSRENRDLIVGTDTEGALCVVDLARDGLQTRARAQLAFHEVASGRAVTLDVTELYIFDVQVLELLLDAPGLNDAMYLYGVIRGPYPAEDGATVSTIEGQLTVTRSDLLAALVDGVSDAFMYQPEAHGSRCVHAVLPGERAHVIDAGGGVVLALPLAPAWTIESLVPNDRVAAQIFYDVLGALNQDLGLDVTLPVPSRAGFVHELEKEGWTIEGDRALRAKRSGFLGAILPDRERRDVPPEGTLEDYVAAATAALGRLGPPSPEWLALRRRRGGPAIPTPSPVLPESLLSPVPEVRQPRPRVASHTDWMRDFVDAHRTQTQSTPRVSVPARAVTTTASPAWMNDFAPTEPGKPVSGDDVRDDDDAKKRDWSKDFE